MSFLLGKHTSAPVPRKVSVRWTLVRLDHRMQNIGSDMQ